MGRKRARLVVETLTDPREAQMVRYPGGIAAIPQAPDPFQVGKVEAIDASVPDTIAQPAAAGSRESEHQCTQAEARQYPGREQVKQA